MIKTLSAFAIAALIAAAPFALSLTPYPEAGEPVALAKSGRLVADRGCANQTWPNFTASCLHGNGARLEPRLVSADRG